jgi:sulfur carrier protein
MIALMLVQLSHPSRTVQIKGPKKAKDVLRDLNLVVEAHLVIRGDELVTEDELLSDSDQVEIRPVISGGTTSQDFCSTVDKAYSKLAI